MKRQSCTESDTAVINSHTSKTIVHPGQSWRNMSELGFLKICFIGTAFSFLLALFGLVDSVGGLMYAQEPDWADDSWTEKLPSVSSSQTAAVNNTKRNGSR